MSAVALERTTEDIQQALYMLPAALHCIERAALSWNNLSSPSHAPASDSKYHR